MTAADRAQLDRLLDQAARELAPRAPLNIVGHVITARTLLWTWLAPVKPDPPDEGYTVIEVPV